MVLAFERAPRISIPRRESMKSSLFANRLTSFAAFGCLALSPGLSQAQDPAPVSQVPEPEVCLEPSVSVPPAPVSIDIRWDQSIVTEADQDAWLMVTLQGAADAMTRRSPVSMALVLDASGSMQGDKIETRALRPTHWLTARGRRQPDHHFLRHRC
jgi:hypothetical protein